MPEKRSMPAYTEGNRVVFILPFAWSKGLGAGIIYGVILFGLHSDGFGSRHFHPTYAAVFAAASAIWLLYVGRLRVTTTFDGDEGIVSRKNLLWTQTTLALGEVADIFRWRKTPA